MEVFLKPNNLREARKKKGLPQWKLSIAANVPESRLSKLENGAPPRAIEIKKISSVLNVEAGNIWPEEFGDVQS